MRYAERDILEEIQRRREQVINYLETVIQPNDEQLRKVIDSLRAQAVIDRVRMAELNQPVNSPTSLPATDGGPGLDVMTLPRNLSSYIRALQLATVSV